MHTYRIMYHTNHKKNFYESFVICLFQIYTRNYQRNNNRFSLNFFYKHTVFYIQWRRFDVKSDKLSVYCASFILTGCN